MLTQIGKTMKPAKLEDELFRCAFHNLPIPTLILDEQMTVRAASQSFLERYGYQEDQVLGRRCFQVFHQNQMPCPPSQCRFRAALNGQRGTYNLHEYVNPEGKRMYEEVHLAPLWDDRGQVRGVIETIRDVTEARRLQGSLTESNEFLNRLLDSLVGVVVAADLSGRILFVNKSVERVLGYFSQELVGRELWTITCREELRRVRRALNENGGRVVGIRTHAMHKDGGEIPVRLNSSYVYRDGKPIATVGIMTDLRDQLRMERHLSAARMQVIQSDKMASLGRIAAGVAHELNNPLTGITVYAELLKDTLPPEHPAQSDISYIIEDAERCRDIVKGLLDYARQSEIRVEELDLSEVVDQAFQLLRDDTLFMHVEVVKEYWPEPLMIQGDEKVLRQVFINLITNALDAMKHRGRLTVRTGLDENGMRWAEVSDTGPGIEPEYVSRIFEPFFTTKAPGKGTGLGLSVVFGVVSRHGGTIQVKQSGPEGTTFLVRFPQEAPDSLMVFAQNYILPGDEEKNK